MFGSQGRLILSSARRFKSGHLSASSIRTFAAAREPPLPPLTNPVENAIEAARKRGEFDNLSGSGKPLPKSDAMPATGSGGMSPSVLLSQKAEFEMRRAIRNRELEDLGGQGEKLKYKGTDIGEGGVGEAMGQYILDQADLSAEDLKKVK